MKDGFGRKIEYMRISVTDRCNLRCRYCMPENIELLPMDEILSYEEITRIVKCAVSLGITKFKITGGEPLIRRGVTKLIEMIKHTDGVESVTLTTNGILLSEYIGELKSAGIDGINISLDTLQRERYEKITGTDKIDAVLDGLYKALESGINTKINAVVLSDFTKDNYLELLELARNKKVDVRLIEIMPIGAGYGFKGVDCNTILKDFFEKYPGAIRDDRIHGNGPAEYYSIPGFLGSVGVINSIHDRFCMSCNRIRLTSTGEIKPCLYYNNTFQARDVLRSEKCNDDLIKEILEEAIKSKPCGHEFYKENSNFEKRKMSQIGG